MSVERSSSDAQQALLQAARMGDVTTIDELLNGSEGISVNSRVEKVTFRNLSYDQTVCGITDFEVSFYDATALHVATYFRQPDAVSFLLKHNADLAVAARLVDFGVNFGARDGRHSNTDPKWRYKDATALHLAVSGEECAHFPNIDEGEIDGRRKLVVRCLLGHIRSHLLDNKIDWASNVVEAKCTIKWFYRAEPNYALEDAPALLVALWFSKSTAPSTTPLSRTPFPLAHSSDFALNLLDLVHARPTCGTSTILGVYGEREESARSLAFQRFGRDGELRRACQNKFCKIMKGYRSLWRQASLGVLRGVLGLDNALIIHVLKFAEMSSNEVAYEVLGRVSDKEKHTYLDASDTDEEELFRMALFHDILI